MLPKSYTPVKCFYVSPVEPDTGCIGLGIELGIGEKLRLKLEPESVNFMLRAIIENALDAYHRMYSQSPKSSEIPSSPGSIPEEGQKV